MYIEGCSMTTICIPKVAQSKEIGNKISPLQQEGLTLRLKSKNLKISFELFSTQTFSIFSHRVRVQNTSPFFPHRTSVLFLVSTSSSISIRDLLAASFPFHSFQENYLSRIFSNKKSQSVIFSAMISHFPLKSGGKI